MKQIAMGVVAFIIVVLFVSICLNINARYVREHDVVNNLTEAVEESAKSVFLNEKSRLKTDEEFVQFFVESLVYQIESQDEITIHVVEADLEKGILAVDLTQTFTYSSGEEGNVHYQKTIILDQIAEEERPQYEEVFYLGEEEEKQGKVYKKYILEVGNNLKNPVIPVDPTGEKREFLGWKGEDETVMMIVEGVMKENIYYVASFG